jgi:predicted short-subunit dehydrogenase-like oxidoreductase (DUF2520 family)
MKIALIGAGNVAYHLSKRFAECGVKVIQVFSRTQSRADIVAAKCNAEAITDLSKISRNCDVYLLAVSDSAIPEVSATLVKLGFKSKLIAHTSGATPSTTLSESGCSRFGVFYPLQTMSKLSHPDFNKIPLCVDSINETDLALLTELGLKICPNVFHIPDTQRAVLHVAAVFVNNFANHMFHIGKEILDASDLPFRLLLPLIQETVVKLDQGTPEEMQTGPAKRGDLETVQRHVELLKPFPEYQELYRMLTMSIRRMGEGK